MATTREQSGQSKEKRRKPTIYIVQGITLKVHRKTLYIDIHGTYSYYI